MKLRKNSAELIFRIGLANERFRLNSEAFVFICVALRGCGRYYVGDAGRLGLGILSIFAIIHARTRAYMRVCAYVRIYYYVEMLLC